VNDRKNQEFSPVLPKENDMPGMLMPTDTLTDVVSSPPHAWIACKEFEAFPNIAGVLFRLLLTEML